MKEPPPLIATVTWREPSSVRWQASEDGVTWRDLGTDVSELDAEHYRKLITTGECRSDAEFPITYNHNLKPTR